MKRMHWTMAALVALLAGATAHAGMLPAVVVDDFQAYSLGNLDGQGYWRSVDDSRADGNTQVAIHPGQAGNQVLSTNEFSDIIYNNDPVFAQAMPQGGSATLYFEFRVDNVTDLAFGLAQNAQPGWSFGDFAVQVGTVGGADPGFVNLRARDGGSFKVLATLELRQEYELWFDVDNDSQRYSVLIRGGDFTEQTLLADGDGKTLFGYRNTAVGPLQSMLIHTRGADAYINNILIPEPATMALLALGGLAVLRRRR